MSPDGVLVGLSYEDPDAFGAGELGIVDPNAGLKIQAIDYTLTGAVGTTQDITIPGFGTPKAVEMWLSDGTVDGDGLGC